MCTQNEITESEQYHVGYESRAIWTTCDPPPHPLLDSNQHATSRGKALPRLQTSLSRFELVKRPTYCSPQRISDSFPPLWENRFDNLFYNDEWCIDERYCSWNEIQQGRINLQERSIVVRINMTQKSGIKMQIACCALTFFLQHCTLGTGQKYARDQSCAATPSSLGSFHKIKSAFSLKTST